MFNTNHRMSLRSFNDLLHFLVCENSFCYVPTTWRPDPVWLSITCSKRKTYTTRFGGPCTYFSRQTKAIDICNINIRHLQRLMANIIFGRNGSKNVYRKAELFLTWCALTGTHADIGAFIILRLIEVAKTSHENVIGVRDTITAIA